MSKKRIFSSIKEYEASDSVEHMGFNEPRLRKKYGNHVHNAVVGGKDCKFDSDGEHKLADYLQLLKEQGYIKDWERESHSFILMDTSWKIDFTIRNNDDSFEYYEYKGAVEPRTRKLINQTMEFHPQAQITMVMANKKGIEKLGVRARSKCKRVCLLKDLTKGIV